MQLLDSDIHLAKAMIIDANPTSRSVMAAQLRDLGVQNVRQVSRVQDARLVLEQQPHDIVLCEMTFEGAPMSGQDLLDELHREQLLPHSTAFILVTGVATYAQVMEAAEATVDGYLVKPYSAVGLAERLAEVRRRKRSLKPLYDAMRAGDPVRAAEVAQQRFEARESYWNFAAQVAAELWLRADQPDRALAVCEAVIAERPQGWAKAGIARARLAKGELAAARRQLEALVAGEPGYADAHDLLARVLVEQGEFGSALDAFRTAATLTPGCLLRLQHRGALAFYQGQKDEAVQQIERAIALGRKSKLFDVLSLVLLGLLKFDQRDPRGLNAVVDQVVSMAEADPKSPRLRRIRQLLAGLTALQARKTDEALAVAQALAEEVTAPGFDLEAAAFTVSLWVRLPEAAVDAKVLDAMLRAAALRFCVSKASTEVLAASADGRAAVVEIVRNCHTVISNLAEQALNKSLKGQAAAAVEMLLEQGGHTRNAKLIDMAVAVARRHAEHVPDIEAVQQRAKALQDSYCAPLTHLAGVRRSARMPGGVVLRT
jgi:DNA-binding NarL/FixJ family response regulator